MKKEPGYEDYNDKRLQEPNHCEKCGREISDNFDICVECFELKNAQNYDKHFTSFLAQICDLK